MITMFSVILSLILAAVFVNIFITYSKGAIIFLVVFIVMLIFLAFWKNARQNTKIFLKALLVAIPVAATAFLGMLLILLASLNNNKAIAVIVFIAAIAAIILIEMTAFRALKPKALFISWGALIAIIIVSIGAVMAYKAYHNSIPVVRIYLDPDAFRPYSGQYENDRLAKLDEASTLLFTENLPRLDGATALYPVYAAFAKAVYPKEVLVNELEVILEDNAAKIACTTTRFAYDNLIKGDRDVIFVGGPSQDQLEAAKKAGKELIFTPIGREGFVFFVNASNPVNNLTEEQIKAVYSGKISNWKELGGKNKPIKAFQRNNSSGSQSAFLRFMGDEVAIEPIIAERVSSMGGIISTTANYKNYKNAIGFSFRYYTQKMAIDAGIKLLSVNGIAPDRENISSGLYPLTHEFYAVTVAGNENPEVKRFIEWILSPQGQELIEKTGYSPLK